MNRRYEDAIGTCIVSILEIVANNITALMDRERRLKGKLRSYQAIEDATNEIGHMVGRSTADRMSKGRTDFEIGNLEAIAKVFEVEVWQLLAPTFDPSNPPVLRSVGEVEDSVYRKMAANIEELSATLASIKTPER